MTKVLFVNGPASGHVYPTLGLVEELIADGEQVIYVSSEEYREQLERIGAVFYAYDNFLKREDPFQTKSFMDLVIKIVQSYDIILPCIWEISKEHTFDYLIHDSMYGCGQVLADLLQIPHIASCTSFIHAERLLHVNQSNAIAMRENLRQLKTFAAVSEKIREKYQIKRKLDMTNVFFNEGMLNLVYTSRNFQPMSELIPDHYSFIGPCLTERITNTHSLPSDKRDHPTIYISMGTQFNQVQTLYQLCFEALASFEGRVILSVGSRIELDSLGPYPQNCTVVPFVPQLEVLQYTDVFITHGGMNSVNEAMYYHVPVIVIPMAADQPIVGKRVQELGAGIMLERDTLTASQLRTAVEEILTVPSFRLHAASLGDSLRNAGGSRKAIDEIRSFQAAFVQKRSSG